MRGYEGVDDRKDKTSWVYAGCGGGVSGVGGIVVAVVLSHPL